ncbi:DUF4365 domain-containing protein [Clostridium senegalense]
MVLKKILPEVAESHKQERRSIEAFRRELDKDKFIIQEQKEYDYGVDIRIELVLDKRYASNYTACVQIKDKLISKNIKKINGDYSYTVDLKTINYLSNDLNSLFFIYLEDENTFLWEWIDNIKSKIDASDSCESKSNYRFNKILDEKSKCEIYEKIKNISKNINELAKNANIINNPSIYKKIGEREIKILKSLDKQRKKAQEYIKKKDLKKALNIYKNILFVDKDKSLFVKCGYLEIKLEKYTSAIKSFKEAIELDDKNDEALWGIIYSYKCNKQYKKEKIFIEKNIQNIKFAEAYCELSIIYVMNDEIDKALKILNEISESQYLHIENCQVHNLILAEIYLKLFDFKNAKSFIDKLLKKNNQDARAIALLGEYHFELGDYNKAVENFSVALEEDENNYYCLKGLSLIYFSINEDEKALLYFTDFIKLIGYKKNKKVNKNIIIHIGWKETIVIYYEIEKDGFINVYSEDGKMLKTSLDAKDGEIFIGISSVEDSQYIYPMVGKMFYKKEKYDKCIKKIKDSLTFMELIKGNGCYMELTNQTKLDIEEKKKNVYISLTFNQYRISGFTSINWKMNGYKEFVKLYNKEKFFQLTIGCLETKEQFCYTVNNNVSIV